MWLRAPADVDSMHRHKNGYPFGFYSKLNCRGFLEQTSEIVETDFCGSEDQILQTLTRKNIVESVTVDESKAERQKCVAP